MADLLISNYSTRNVFIWNPRFQSRPATYTNGTGAVVTLVAGTILGRIAATGKLTPCMSTATDGSQVPMGILGASYSVAIGADQTITYCIAGDVDANALIFAHAGDTLDTEITTTDSGSATTNIGTIGDILIRSGIIPVASTEMTYQDNQ